MGKFINNFFEGLKRFIIVFSFIFVLGCSIPASAPADLNVEKIDIKKDTIKSVAGISETMEPVVSEEEKPVADKEFKPAAVIDPVREIVDNMSDEELLGQMIMVGFSGAKDMPRNIKNLIGKYKIGGIFLFGWNVNTFNQTKSLIEKINSNNPYPKLPFLIGIDVEGGSVRRFNWRPRLKSAAYMGRAYKPKEVYRKFLYVGKKLKETGININFAPVADIAPNPKKTFLKTRMFGSAPEKVIPLTNMVIRGLKDGGVLSLVKHFPGIGSTVKDSHKTLPVIRSTKEEIYGYALKPFAAAIEEGVDAVMTGHVLVPALDKKYPSPLSKSTITGLLRNEMGFNGLVISDDMRMSAIVKNYDIGEACVMFIEAGGDVVLIGKYYNKQVKAVKALDNALKSGRLTRQRLEESAYRIVSAKLRFLNNI